MMLQSEPQVLEQRIVARPKRWTNNVLVDQQTHKVTYFLPCYLRMKIKNIQSIDITKMQGEISCDMIFTIFYGALSRHIVEYLKSATILQYNRNDSIELSSQNTFVTMNQNYHEKTLNFTIRNTLTTQIEGDLRLSPFQLLKMKLIVSIRSICIGKEELESDKDIILKFNFMDHPNPTLKLSYGKKVTWQSYSLAPNHTYVAYTNYIIPQNQLVQPSYYPESRTDIYIQQYLQTNNQKKEANLCSHQVKHFQYAHFYIGIYRYPMASVATVYVPMWSMAFYNLFVYFQYLNDLAMKLNNGLVILLTLFVYLPTIRSEIPDKPYLIVSQILLLIICLTFILNMISGVCFYQQHLGADPSILLFYSVDWWFYVSMVLVLLTFLAILVISIVHKVYWQPSYLRENQNGNTLQAFNHRKWGNKHSDIYFSSQKFNCIQVYP